MVSDHVDTVSKSLRPETRRNTLRMLAGGSLAGVITAVLPAAGGARTKKSKGKKGKKSGNKPGKPLHTPGCPDCTCPPDRRLAGVETCRAKGGIAVGGACDCAFFNHEISNFYGCDRNSTECLCMFTAERTGFCAYGQAFTVDGPGQACESSAQCPPVDIGRGLVLDQACAYWPGTGTFQCFEACQPRSA